VRVAPHVKLLRRAADVDRDRFERELRLERRLGGGVLPDLGLLGGVPCGRSGVELRRGVGPGGVELRRQLRGPGGGLLLALLSPRPGLIRPCGGESLVGGREFGAASGAASRSAVAAAFFALSAACTASAASRASVSARAGAAGTTSAFGMNSAGWENSTGAASFGEMITRIPIRVLSNSFSAKP